MPYRILFLLSCIILAMSPTLSHAEIFKCVNAAGKINYSDHPCSNQEGEKAAEVKDSVGFAALQARDNAKKIGQTCWTLAHRASQCDVSIGNALQTNFRDNCSVPIKQFEKDSEHEQYDRERELYRNRVRNRSNNNDQVDDVSLDYSNRYQRKSKEALRCEVLPAETWSFVKQNFSKKISEKDTKEIEYYLNAVPSDGRESEPYRRRK